MRTSWSLKSSLATKEEASIGAGGGACACACAAAFARAAAEERSLLRGAIVEDVAGERGGGCAGELKRRETCGWDADGT